MRPDIRWRLCRFPDHQGAYNLRCLQTVRDRTTGELRQCRRAMERCRLHCTTHRIGALKA